LNYLALLKAVASTTALLLLLMSLIYLIVNYALIILVGMVGLGLTVVVGLLTLLFYETYKK
jgi:hypothetical protein